MSSFLVYATQLARSTHKEKAKTAITETADTEDVTKEPLNLTARGS